MIASPTKSRDLRSCQRSGMTLFEVVLAMAIFVGSFAAISQILRTGSTAAVRARLQSEAALRCDGKMNEVLAGIIPLETTSEEAFPDDPAWNWTLALLDSGVLNLWRLELTVRRAGQNPQSTVETTIVRFYRDPQALADAAAAAAAAASSTSESSTSSSLGGGL